MTSMSVVRTIGCRANRRSGAQAGSGSCSASLAEGCARVVQYLPEGNAFTARELRFRLVDRLVKSCSVVVIEAVRGVDDDELDLRSVRKVGRLIDVEAAAGNASMNRPGHPA